MTNRSAAVAVKSAEKAPSVDWLWQKAARWLNIAAAMKIYLRSFAAFLGCLCLSSCFSMRAMEKNASSDPNEMPPTGGLGGAALLDLVTLPVQIPWMAYRSLTGQ
jgi:hypothetical protein